MHTGLHFWEDYAVCVSIRETFPPANSSSSSSWTGPGLDTGYGEITGGQAFSSAPCPFLWSQSRSGGNILDCGRGLSKAKQTLIGIELIYQRHLHGFINTSQNKIFSPELEATREAGNRTE